MTASTCQEKNAGSFRDPSGVVFNRDGRILRQVNDAYREQYDALLSSGLFEQLVAKSMLINHREVDEAGVEGSPYKVIEPDIIDLISYPYEWSFSQLKDAALMTLRIHRHALDHDMVLKDASAYNIQFDHGRPVHIDTLSFDFYREDEPWVAYGQFCRHFLAPLYLMNFVDLRLLQLMHVYIDGIPLDFASKLLGSKGGFGAKSHIHWHAKSVVKHGQAGQHAQSQPAQIKLSKFKMTAMIDSLIKTVEKLELKGEQTEWGDYTDRTSYSQIGADSKKRVVSRFIETVTPSITWDLGGNDGTYSRLALRGGDEFVAVFDIDPLAVERNYREVRETQENLLPLLVDLTNPSPAMGFAGKERPNLPDRQTPDCILMLAVIHHLAISNNLPMEMIAAWLSDISAHLIIEFVPKSDPQVQVLLATREDIFDTYHEQGFEAAFSQKFDIIEKCRLDASERVLYLMKRKDTLQTHEDKAGN
jgi:ribosomal protein L11 methylase PrmA